jgi:hypothetical protein
MVPIESFRRLLGPEHADLSNEQLEQLRTEMCAFANVSLEMFDAFRRQRRLAFELLPSPEGDAAEERAAIIEFDGGADRDRAERSALSLVRSN